LSFLLKTSAKAVHGQILMAWYQHGGLVASISTETTREITQQQKNQSLSPKQVGVDYS
jgi:hypothetical protein